MTDITFNINNNKTFILNEWDEIRKAFSAETDEEWATLKHAFFAGALTAAAKMMNSSLDESLGILKELKDWSAGIHEQCQE